MKSIHFSKISSTQTYLRDNWEQLSKDHKTKEVLISCDYQSQGLGRNQNVWEDLSGESQVKTEEDTKSLAFSFSISPHPQRPTLTTFEMVILTAFYFEEKWQSDPIKLKWPNDMMTFEKKKFAGILANSLDSSFFAMGIGINLYSKEKVFSSYKTAHDFLFSNKKIDLSKTYKKDIPLEIYSYILENRKKFENTQDLINEFEKRCFHLKEEVRIINETKIIKGIFEGIGEFGQALIGGEEVYTGSLFFNS